MVEATEHHEIVLEVEGELRGLHKALDIMLRNNDKFDITNQGLHIMIRGCAITELRQEIEFVKEALDEITEEE